MKPFNVFPYDSRFDFLRLRWVSAAIAILLVVVSIGAIATKSFNFALDFTGGTSVEVRFEQPVDVEDMRARLATAGFDNAQVQTLGSGRELLVRLQPREGEAAAEGADAEEDASAIADEVIAAMSVEDNPATRLSSGYVGPQIGEELAQNGVYAMLFVVIGFLVYISFRFEWKFAVAATLTTMHDIVVVLGWFAITGRDFDLTVLAGVLSVMGFSINDTIVVFDRVRENFRAMRAEPMAILNRSINQTLSRTVITSFVAFLTVLALYLYGGGSLEGMAEAMLVGIILGTVSTIFVACPLVLWLGVTKQDLMPKSRDEAELARRP